LARHVVREDHEEDEHDDAGLHDAGCACDRRAECERENDAQLDDRVEETGDEAGSESGEHQFERDALRRRDGDAFVEGHVANVEELGQARAPEWAELPRRVEAARTSPARLGPDAVRRLAPLYRATAADLAIARRRYPHDPVVARLDTLVQRGRQAVYHTTPRTA